MFIMVLLIGIICWIGFAMVKSPAFWIIAIICIPFWVIGSLYDLAVSDVMWNSDVSTYIKYNGLASGSQFDNRSYHPIISVSVTNTHKSRRSPDNLWLACNNSSRYAGIEGVEYSVMYAGPLESNTKGVVPQYATANGTSLLAFDPLTSTGRETLRPGAYGCAIGYSHDDAIKAASKNR